ncbi:metal-dependent hydrolase [Natronoarchaeum sp. GCM10025703]|uniref:metal-dependent hydrolase n=1 Tax=unclassified Natronoarchaeum TaxID=2620183 RepID=UPI003619A9FF
MWPWGHAAVGYLLYSAYTRSRGDRRPLAIATIILAVGTQFPDLIDKPFSWTFGILPTGRTLAHTLLVLVPLTVAIYVACKRLRRLRSEWAIAFAIGALSHVVVDAIPSVVWGDVAMGNFLLWPLLSVPPYENSSPSIIGAFLAFDLSNYVLFEFALVALAIGVWWADGRPGLSYLRNRFRKELAPSRDST